MGALQYIYTSSKKGYGVYSKTIGLSLDECKQITINSRYVRPQELTGEDIVDFSDFPVKLSRFKLRNHRWVISQSVYLGKDNTGRQGNYFTHGLVFEKEEPVTMSILNYNFRTELTEMEFNNTSPAPLSEISNFPLFNKMNLMRFVNDNRKDVERIIDLFLESQQSNKKLVILDKNKKVIQYINVLFNLLPSNIMKNIEFSSYVERITNVFDIVGVYNNNMRFDNRLILFEAGSGEETSTFSQSLVNDYLNNTVRKEFTLFANALKKNEIHDRIRVLYDLFSGAVVNNDVFFDLLRSLPNKDEEIVNEVIDFVVENEYSKNINLEYFKVLMRFVGRSVQEEKYFALIKECASNGNDEIVQEILKYDIIYSEAFLEYCNDEEMAVQLRTLLISVNSELLGRTLGFKYLLNLDTLFGSADEAVLQNSKNVVSKLIDMLLVRNIENSLVDEPPYSKIISVFTKVLSHDEIRHFITQSLKKQYSDIEGSYYLVSNSFKFLFILKGFPGIGQFLNMFNDRRNRRELKQFLRIIHSLMEEEEFGNVKKADVSKYFFRSFSFYFDLLSRRNQNRMIKRWYKFELEGQIILKPDYLLISVSIIGFVAIATVVFSFIEQRIAPKVEAPEEPYQFMIYEKDNIDLDKLTGLEVTDFMNNDIANSYHKYFDIVDDYKVGLNEVKFYVIDYDHNKSNSGVVKIEILPDDLSPILELSKDEVVIEQDEFDASNFVYTMYSSYVFLTVDDNSFSSPDTINVFAIDSKKQNYTISYSFDEKTMFEEGTTKLWITVNDNYENSASISLNVTLKDKIPPVILNHSGITEIELNKAVSVDLFSFDIEGAYTEVLFDGELNTEEVGEKTIFVLAIDPSGNISEPYPITITVVEPEEPTDG